MVASWGCTVPATTAGKDRTSQEEGCGWGRRGETPATGGDGTELPRDLLAVQAGLHAADSDSGSSDLSWDRAELLERGTEGRRAKLRVAGAALEPQLPA
jgi:hypothetical protein